MVQLASAPTASVVAPNPSAHLLDNAATDASTAAYLASSERMGVVVDLCWKVCAGLIVLVVLAWAVGVLPGAVKLFH